jgi:hypothetical protein
MRSRLLISVSAAALIAGAGLATAQDKGGPAAAPQNTSPAQQSAPPASQPGGNNMPGGADIQQRQEAPPTRAQQDMNRGEQKQQRAQDQREQRQDQRNQRGNQAEDKSAPKAGSTATDTKSDRKSGATTGQGAAGSGAASLTGEQRTRISTTIRQSNVKPVTNVNFNISVGNVVPRSVSLHPLPPAVVEVYPQWRGYRFVLVEDEIIVIEPGSYRIVAVIDA